MQTQMLSNNQADIKTAVDFLKAGELVAFPTETVYGLGADATNEEAVKKVFLAKGRPSDNPLIVTVSKDIEIADYAKLNDNFIKLKEAFWPGPLTMILPMKDDSFSKSVTGGLQTVAFRMPANQLTLDVISQLKKPIVGPSANSSGKPSPTTADHVFHDMNQKIAAILNDGPTEVGVESTVVDLSNETPVILRPGKLTAKDLADVLGVDVLDATSNISLPSGQIPKAPGMKYRHYAPDKQVIMFDRLDIDRLNEVLTTDDVVMALDETLAKIKVTSDHSWSLGKDVNSAAEALFSGLRYYDDIFDVNTIYVEVMPNESVGAAYNNRLAKAASNQYLQ